MGSQVVASPILASLGVAALFLAACTGRSDGPKPVLLLDRSGVGTASESLDSESRRGWDLHWSYDCSNAGGHGVFIVDVYDADKTPDFKAPGVSEEGGRDSGVYHVPESGRFYLEVTSTCMWTLKVVEGT